MRDKLSGAENMIRELNEINRRLEQEKHELQEYNEYKENKLADLNLQLNNAKKNKKLEQSAGLQLQHENALERMQYAIDVSKERERKLQEENNTLRYEKQSVITRYEYIESQRKQCEDELINTQNELQRVQDEAENRVELLTLQIRRLEESVANLQNAKESANTRHLHVSQKLTKAEGQCENTLNGTKQQVLRLQYEATEREDLLNSLQENVIVVKGAKESADEGQAKLQRQHKEANVKIQKIEQRLLMFQSNHDVETAKLRTQVEDLNKEIYDKNNKLRNALSELSKQKNESQMLKEQLNKINEKLKFEKEAREEKNKHKKDLEYFKNKFQEEVDAAIMRVKKNCREIQSGFTFKENVLLAKITNAERNIHQLNDISSKYRAIRQELETTNREHHEHLKSFNDSERSIQQLQMDILKMRKDNTKLQEHVRTLTSNLAITSEENKKLQQQLETLKNQANIEQVEKGRQLSDMLLRIEEQRNKHIDEVRQIQLQYKKNIKLTTDANLREQSAIDTKTVLEGKIKILEKTLSEINDEHEKKQQELLKNISLSSDKIEELHTQLQNAQASERNLTTRLKERDHELEQLSAIKRKKNSERECFEEKIDEKEQELQQNNEKLQYCYEEIQILKQELHQTKSKLKESVKNNEASVKAQVKSSEDDALLRQVNQFRSKEKELAAEIDKLRLRLKDSHNELEETKTRLSKLMGQRLTDNNPNITDLSDKNRPTKLAERYSELYDNEWTDAFGDLNAIYNDEQKTIAMLTGILTEAASYCRNEADGQMVNLRNALTLQTTSSASRGQDVPDVINKQLKDSRKTLSDRAGKHLVETYIQRLRQLPSASAREALRVETFLREVVPLCWLMSIQDPPVVFDRLLNHGEKFNTELYRSYTKAGPLVDFPVWPAMFLHEGGPVLYKGVSQGCNKKQVADKSNDTNECFDRT